MSKLLLVDGHAILHRAYHALPFLSNEKNELTGAIYGFLAILLRTTNNLKPTHLIVTFDRKEPTFRKKILVSYQAQRPKPPEELISQILRLHELLEKMGIRIFEAAGYEADDVIGTLTQQAKGEEVVIITGDRDILQLVNSKTKVLMPVKGISESRLYGEDEVVERMGVAPNEIIDLKALIGDASDNYSGVPGIGPKTAINLIKKYKTLEGIYQNINEIEGKVKEKLIKGEESAKISKTLATITKDAPVELNWNNCKLIRLDNPYIVSLFEEWGFRSLVPRLSGNMNQESRIKNQENKKQKKIEVKKTNVEQTSLF